MGQSANNAGRNATLDEQKRRAAGRGKNAAPEPQAIKDSVDRASAKGAAGGAFGKQGHANRQGAKVGAGGGGGGADPKSRIADVGASRRRAR